MFKTLFALACAAAISAPMSARAGEVHNRQIRQEHRIAQGASSGTLSPREDARLQAQEARLNAQRQRDLHDGDGSDGLSARQAVHLNHEQNHLSREIYRAKHDGPNH